VEENKCRVLDSARAVEEIGMKATIPSGCSSLGGNKTTQSRLELEFFFKFSFTLSNCRVEFQGTRTVIGEFIHLGISVRNQVRVQLQIHRTRAEFVRKAFRFDEFRITSKNALNAVT
jgi:hypothetical protein